MMQFHPTTLSPTGVLITEGTRGEGAFLLNSEGAQVGRGFEGDPKTWALHDRWIVSRLNKTARAVSAAVEAYQFHEAVYALYHFFWDDFCDWYIELAKTRLPGTPEGVPGTCFTDS